MKIHISAKKGFTLLEMLVYLTLSLISIALLSMAISGMYTHILQAITTTNDRMQLHIALICMKKDIEQCLQVITVSPDELVLSSPKGHIAWLQVGRHLVRRTGTYQIHTGYWAKKNSQKLAFNIEKITFSRLKEAIIAEITVGSYVHKSSFIPKIGMIL